tara:strand:+ start:141 stop:464 length:324 start_codon:yes stop_codon:yes gene_type:complete
MSEFLSKKKNLFRKNILYKEKKRIKLIIELIIKSDGNDKFKNILMKYKEIFNKKEKEKEKKIKMLRNTADYLKEQINTMIESNRNTYLINEMHIEVKKIEDIILQLK